MKRLLYFTIVFFVIGAILFFALYAKETKVMYEEEFAVNAEEFDIDKNLIMAVAKTESGFDAKAKSRAGAVGVMQLMPSTAKWVSDELGIDYSEEKLIDPKVNIKLGSYYLSHLIKKYKDTVYALACYNAGENIVKNWGSPGSLKIDDIKYVETQNFVKKVLLQKQKYDK